MADPIQNLAYAGNAGAWRDYETLGVPATGPHAPAKSEIAAFADQVATRVVALENSFSADAIAEPTWALLSPIAGTRLGEKGEVYGPDAGTHTDPVVGGTVPNVGVYSWSTSPAGWRWSGPDPVSSKAPNDSPSLTGTPSAPTPATGDRSTRIATSSFVGAELGGVQEVLTHRNLWPDTDFNWAVTSPCVHSGYNLVSVINVQNGYYDAAVKLPHGGGGWFHDGTTGSRGFNILWNLDENSNINFTPGTDKVSIGAFVYGSAGIKGLMNAIGLGTDDSHTTGSATNVEFTNSGTGLTLVQIHGWTPPAGATTGVDVYFTKSSTGAGPFWVAALWVVPGPTAPSMPPPNPMAIGYERRLPVQLDPLPPQDAPFVFKTAPISRPNAFVAGAYGIASPFAWTGATFDHLLAAPRASKPNARLRAEITDSTFTKVLSSVDFRGPKRQSDVLAIPIPRVLAGSSATLYARIYDPKGVVQVSGHFLGAPGHENYDSAAMNYNPSTGTPQRYYTGGGNWTYPTGGTSVGIADGTGFPMFFGVYDSQAAIPDARISPDRNVLQLTQDAWAISNQQFDLYYRCATTRSPYTTEFEIKLTNSGDTNFANQQNSPYVNMGKQRGGTTGTSNPVPNAGNGASPLTDAYEYTPTSVSVADYYLKTSIFSRDDDEPFASKTQNFRTCGSTQAAGAALPVMVIGNSHWSQQANGGGPSILQECIRLGQENASNLQVTGIGTQGTAPNRSMGIGGATAGAMVGPNSPIGSGTTYFDMATLLSSNGPLPTPKVFVWGLGTQEMYNCFTDADAVAAAKLTCDQYEAMIGSKTNAFVVSTCRSVAPSALHGIQLPMPPCSSQDGFGNALNLGKSRRQYLRHLAILNDVILSRFEGRQVSDNIYVLPLNVSVDVDNGFQKAGYPLFPDSPNLIYRHSDGIHPSPTWPFKAAITMATGSPGILTLPGGISPLDGQPFTLSTTGALLSGLNPGQTYYCVRTKPDLTTYTGGQFGVALTPGGTQIVLSGTQTGTHTADAPGQGAYALAGKMLFAWLTNMRVRGYIT